MLRCDNERLLDDFLRLIFSQPGLEGKTEDQLAINVVELLVISNGKRGENCFKSHSLIMKTKADGFRFNAATKMDQCSL